MRTLTWSKAVSDGPRMTLIEFKSGRVHSATIDPSLRLSVVP